MAPCKVERKCSYLQISLSVFFLFFFFFSSMWIFIMSFLKYPDKYPDRPGLYPSFLILVSEKWDLDGLVFIDPPRTTFSFQEEEEKEEEEKEEEAEKPVPVVPHASSMITVQGRATSSFHSHGQHLTPLVCSEYLREEDISQCWPHLQNPLGGSPCLCWPLFSAGPPQHVLDIWGMHW